MGALGSPLHPEPHANKGFSISWILLLQIAANHDQADPIHREACYQQDSTGTEATESISKYGRGADCNNVGSAVFREW